MQPTLILNRTGTHLSSIRDLSFSTNIRCCVRLAYIYIYIYIYVCVYGEELYECKIHNSKNWYFLLLFLFPTILSPYEPKIWTLLMKRHGGFAIVSAVKEWLSVYLFCQGLCIGTWYCTGCVTCTLRKNNVLKLSPFTLQESVVNRAAVQTLLCVTWVTIKLSCVKKEKTNKMQQLDIYY